MLVGCEHPVDLVKGLVALLNDLYCVGEIDNVDSISPVLVRQGLKYQNELLRGNWFELTLQDLKAVESFKAANRIHTDDPLPIRKVGEIELRLENLDSAETAIFEYLSLNPNDSTLLIQLTEAFERKKDWSKLVELYEKIHSLHPGVLSNPQVISRYKKACKKAGVQAVRL